MPVQSTPFHREQKKAARPIWLEVFAGLDWMALRTSPVYLGLGVPRGDGSAVILVPGFMGTDLYLREMHDWLRRIGYRPYMSGIGRNAECLDVLVARLGKTVEKANSETGRKAHMVGHSLGGILARSIASLKPELVTSVITLGSPFRGISSHPLVLQMAGIVRERINRERPRGNQPDCYTGYCECSAVTAVQSSFPESVAQTAIYTKSDGVVDWRVCINDNPETDREVLGTHVGLAFNLYVYELIANRLAAA